MSTTRPALIPPEEMEKEIARQQDFIDEIRDLPQKPRSFFVVTYGCQMNAHDSEKLAGMLSLMGISHAPSREEADFVIFNTCCIRENAERKALGNITWLREVRKRNPRLIIAVCGCMIQQPGMAEKILNQYRFIDLAFGTADLHRFPELLLRFLNTDRRTVVVGDQDAVPEGLPILRTRRDFAYLTVMYGCNNYCSYCIVPYVRGRERSRDPGKILLEAESLLDSGVKEIMLLGQNVNSYGSDLPASPSRLSFSGLLRALDSLGVPRIRFMTSHPKDLSDELIDTIASCPHVLPQFHLPVQSGSDRILQLMNRRYTRARYLDRVSRLRDAVPHIGLSTDLIVAFPGETDEDFRDTISLVEEVRFDSAFTFVYSPRPGTRAATMPDQVDPAVASARIEQLISLQESLQQQTLSRFIGSLEQVLVEGISRRSATEISGKGLHGVSVTLPGSPEEIGTIIPCRITGIKQNTLTAVRLDQ